MILEAEETGKCNVCGLPSEGEDRYSKKEWCKGCWEKNKESLMRWLHGAAAPQPRPARRGKVTDG